MNEKIKNEEYINAVLAGVDTGEYDAEISMDELEELAKTAGAVTVCRVIQKRPAEDAATVIGEGKLRELTEAAQSLDAQLIIFDTELSSSQIRNIEDITNIRVIDRTMLILDIFAMRAVTNEGKLQVEAAQLKYRLSRLAGLGTSLSRLGGGIGTRGPGETKLESDRRHIRRRLDKLNDELAELEKRRTVTRKRRKKDDVLVGAIVGYTNAGKSTLLNTLTDAGVLAEDKLFATLDLTSRAIELPDGRSLTLIDTVGLIRRLPHHLVEAFKSTLEEAASADIILHVCDISDEQLADKIKTTEQLLGELGCGDIPVINVLNKCDKTDYDFPEDESTVKISAKTGQGLDRLKQVIADKLSDRVVTLSLSFPYESAADAASVRKYGSIISEEYLPEAIKITAVIEKKYKNKFSAFITE
ncbi:MAG: GTPase HflX [Eubacterium sp.]|nr:GTPase HflX [Eubacterium sp.]